MSMHFSASVWISERILGRIDTSVTLIHCLSRDIVTNALVEKLIVLMGLELGLRGGAFTR